MKTAIDYIDSVLIDLIEKFDSKEYDIARNTLINFKNVVIEQAKEMEKEQIIDACEQCSYSYEEAEQYYNETFKSEE